MTLEKTVLTNYTSMSLDERFSQLRRADTRLLVTDLRQQCASSESRRLALQMSRRPSVIAALNSRRGGNIGRRGAQVGRGNIRSIGRGRRSNSVVRGVNRPLRRSGSVGRLARSQSLTSLHSRSASPFRARGRGVGRGRGFTRGARGVSGFRRGSLNRRGGLGIAASGGGFVTKRGRGRGARGGFNTNRGGFNTGRGSFGTGRGSFGTVRSSYGNNRGGFANNRGGFSNNRGGFANNRGSFGAGTGRGRGRGRGAGRGGFRGRGGKGLQRTPPPSKEKLDMELDEYMASSKASLDKEIDTYMSQTQEKWD